MAGGGSGSLIGYADLRERANRLSGALLDLAMERMEKALQAGGNRVESNADTPAQRPISIPHALELLRVRRPDAVRPHLDVLLSQLLPLLALMDETLTLGLPMDVIQRRAADTAGKK